MINKYIYITTDNAESPNYFKIENSSHKHTKPSALRVLTGLYHAKIKDPAKVENTTSSTLDELAQKVFSGYEGKWCLVRKAIDNFLQYFCVTERGEIHRIYKQILNIEPAQSVEIPFPLKPLAEGKFATPSSLFEFIVAEKEKLVKLAKIKDADLETIDNQLTTFESLGNPAKDIYLARFKSLFSIVFSLKKITDKIESQAPEDEDSYNIDSHQHIQQNLTVVMAYATVYLGKFGGARERQLVAKYNQECEEFLGKFKDQILTIIEDSQSKA